MKKKLVDTDKWCQEKCDQMGIDYFPIHWEVVPEEVMLEIMSYGLPTRARHWSYGQGYKYQKLNGEMGMSKVYELILNSDPSYAFLLDTNPDVAQQMVIAHCYGHSAFFKNNYLFKQTDRKMVYHAAERAARIDEYIAKYGIDRVEHIMDIAFAIDKNIDWHKGLHRKRYAKKKKTLKRSIQDEFEDLLSGKESRDVTPLERSMPPHPEYDLLWFFINYSPKLEDWERDVMQIAREESFYFYPQMMTKIMNEGFASYVHAELMFLMDKDLLPASEHLEFVKIHERVVQPGRNPMNINPYFLGFTILNDIKKRWDEKFRNGESDIDGWNKILKVVEEEDDISFLKNYLTQEIVDELKMFTYTTFYDKRKGEVIKVRSKKAEDVIEAKVSKLYNYRAPLIAVTKASPIGLELEHRSESIGTLDQKHLSKVLGYIYEIWGDVVDLKTIDEHGSIIHFTYDEEGLSIDDIPPVLTAK